MQNTVALLELALASLVPGEMQCIQGVTIPRHSFPYML